MIITEKLTDGECYAKIDGAGRDLPEVKQLSGLKLRYLPPGASQPVKTKKEEEKKKTPSKSKSNENTVDMKKEKKSKKEKATKKKSK